MSKTTRQELMDIIRMRLGFFTEMGCKPDDERVAGAMADYIIALAPHILPGKVQFDTKVVDESIKSNGD